MNFKELFFVAAGPCALATFFLWGHSLFKKHSSFLREKENLFLLGLAILCSTLIFASTEIAFKVLSDEANLLSVGNMLALFGKASNTEMWVRYYDAFHPLDFQVPTRPILFPLLVALLHETTGFRAANAFAVNFLLLAALFLLTLRWIRTKSTHNYSIVFAIAALGMNSALAIYSTSAGFDLCSLVLGFSLYLAVEKYARTKESDDLKVLFYTALLFSWTRYESIVALPIVFGFLFLQEKFSLFKKLSWTHWVTGILLLFPLVLQRILTWGSFENPPDMPAFALSHFRAHFPYFVRAFFIDFSGPYPLALHWLGLWVTIIWLIKRNFGQAEKAAGLYLLFLFALLLSHHFGYAGHPTQVRLFLPLTFALTLLAIARLDAIINLTGVIAPGVAFLLLVFHHQHYSVHDPLTSQLTMTREVKHLRRFLATNTEVGDLYVYDRPIHLTALGKSAISWNQFRDHRADYLGNLKLGLFQRIIAVERIPYDIKAPQGDESLKGLKVTPLAFFELSPAEKFQIALVQE